VLVVAVMVSTQPTAWTDKPPRRRREGSVSDDTLLSVAGQSPSRHRSSEDVLVTSARPAERSGHLCRAAGRRKTPEKTCQRVAQNCCSFHRHSSAESRPTASRWVAAYSLRYHSHTKRYLNTITIACTNTRQATEEHPSLCVKANESFV